MIIQELITSIAKLPGIGKKTAIRMVYDILAQDKLYSKHLGENLINLHLRIKKCKNCYNFTENEICEICTSLSRNRKLICVVENPQDLEMLESTREYYGLYFVLHGHLDPLKDIGPKSLNLHKLHDYVKDLGITEVIVATEFSIEGDVTAHYIGDILKDLRVETTRIASGLPAGGSLSTADKRTTLRALNSRLKI